MAVLAGFVIQENILYDVFSAFSGAVLKQQPPRKTLESRECKNNSSILIKT